MKTAIKITLILLICLFMRTIFTPQEHSCTLHAEEEELGTTHEQPDSLILEEKTTKTIAQVNLERCIKCGLCANICPSKAIQMVEHKPVIDPYLCISCGDCVKRCPTRALALTEFQPADSVCAAAKKAEEEKAE